MSSISPVSSVLRNPIASQLTTQTTSANANTALARNTNANAAAATSVQRGSAQRYQSISAQTYYADSGITRNPTRVSNNRLMLGSQGQIDGSNSRADVTSNLNQLPKIDRINGTLLAKANANTVPNIPVYSDTYQGREVKHGGGAKHGDRIEGFSQQDKRWAALPYIWAPGVPVVGWGKQEGTWGDQPALRQGHGRYPTPYYDSKGKMVMIGGIGCTATALTNGLRAANPQSGITPENAAKLDKKFISTMKATQFLDLSGQGKQLYDRGEKEGPKIERMDPVQVGSSKGNDIVNKIRQSLENRNSVLVGFRNGNGDGTIRHTSLAVGYANGQIQILDSETGKVGPMDAFLKDYGYTDAKFDYAYAMSKK